VLFAAIISGISPKMINGDSRSLVKNDCSIDFSGKASKKLDVITTAINRVAHGPCGMGELKSRVNIKKIFNVITA
jgi:hypothetical protein